MEPIGLFGRICVEKGFVTQEQLAECLRIQAQLGGRHHLGKLLLNRGLINEAQVQEVLRVQRERQASAAPLPPPPAASAPEPILTPPPPPAKPVAASQGRLAVLLEAAERKGASDLHVHPGAPLALRAGGRLMVTTQPPLEAADLEAQLLQLLDDAQKAQLERELFAEPILVTPNGLRCRAALYRAHGGLHGTFRILRRKPATLAELGLPTQLAGLTAHGQGLVLVAGLAGSGKTNTLAALVDVIAEERPEHVLCLEDPIEILHTPKKALVNQRQVGRDSASYARALRGALREDPDVIVIGDLRDAESIALAVTAAETGHLVLAGMNTASATRAIGRIIGAFPPSQQTQVRAMISESLKGVVTQRLMPTVDGGLAAAVEVLIVTPAVGNLIREDKLFQVRSQMQTGKASGMRTMDEALRELVAAGRVAPDEAKRVAENPALIPNGPSSPPPARPPQRTA